MLKRALDVIFSLLGLILLFPFFLALAVIIKSEDREPVFYRGLRIGRHGRPFRIFKFRTMTADAEKRGASSTPDDDSRITKAGKFLRKYKIDEWPQLINILKGEMSFVGPRPQVPWAVRLYTKDEKDVLLRLRPGITDYASIKFRNEGEILKGSSDPDRDYLEKIHPEKMRLAMEYARNTSLLTDADILLKTFLCIFER